MREVSPGLDGSSVEVELGGLLGCARVFWLWFGLVVAGSVAVVECDVAY